MTECIFCRIVSGQIPCAKVYEDEHVLAFLDINPLMPGHTLLIPKKHADTLFDMTSEEVAACGAALQKVATAVFKGTDAEGLNILQNNYEISGQEIFHVHFHLMPRKTGDGFKVPWPAKKYSPGEMERVLKRILEAF
ncbi:HIT family protein [Desulfosoma caldarium]|uniref:Histidine triad (HIT) family protein n=1 Tax=Desulfosoma caldarium TaxID=610254 RepID=A0A3N1VK84_9BACT|nr:HIT family protein [Desulfosoma caldarium]ROR03223.1 histidine triad (HIT) family protein [Desulfosoma caldarium]